MLGFITFGTIKLGVTSRFYDSRFYEINIEPTVVDLNDQMRKEP